MDRGASLLTIRLRPRTNWVRVLSQFMTWGDVKEMQRKPGRMEFLSFGYLFEPEMLKQAKNKHDDEFFFELSPELIAEARRQRWPRVPRNGEPVQHEVIIAAGGKLPGTRRVDMHRARRQRSGIL